MFIHGQNERAKVTVLVMCMRLDCFTLFPLDSVNSKDGDARAASLIAMDRMMAYLPRPAR